MDYPQFTFLEKIRGRENIIQDFKNWLIIWTEKGGFPIIAWENKIDISRRLHWIPVEMASEQRLLRNSLLMTHHLRGRANGPVPLLFLGENLKKRRLPLHSESMTQRNFTFEFTKFVVRANFLTPQVCLNPRTICPPFFRNWTRL